MIRFIPWQQKTSCLPCSICFMEQIMIGLDGIISNCGVLCYHLNSYIRDNATIQEITLSYKSQ